MTKKEEKEIKNWYLDYFVKKIAPICLLSGYQIEVVVNQDDKDETFGVWVNFPYRFVRLYVKEEGVRYYKEKDIKEINKGLLHEAFHILHWKYRQYAEARFANLETLREIEEDMADRFSLIVEELVKTNIKI